MTLIKDVEAMIELEQLHARREYKKLAKHPQIYLKPEYVKELVNDGGWSTLKSLVGNPAIVQFHEELEDLLWRDMDPAHEGDRPEWAFRDPLKDYFANNAALNSPDAVISLAQANPANVRQAVAETPLMAQLPDVAMKLANDEESQVRYGLAQNEALAQLPEVAMKLANDSDEWLRADLARNPSIFQLPKVAMKLANDDSGWVRSHLAENYEAVRLSVVAMKLANDEDFRVRYNLVRNPSIAQLPDVITTLAHDNQICAHLNSNGEAALFLPAVRAAFHDPFDSQVSGIS